MVVAIVRVRSFSLYHKDTQPSFVLEENTALKSLIEVIICKLTRAVYFVYYLMF